MSTMHCPKNQHSVGLHCLTSKRRSVSVWGMAGRGQHSQDPPLFLLLIKGSSSWNRPQQGSSRKG
ncbi:hypothetical protein EYF80_014785 [Liparis tanakae]|uniref:Uncharacterized protein n=1 Tax=Liparis tanakae TaxID=230148 RepID=A0A4Z2IAE2_9TELE|nr:hypothetical protein EYF80_014785 [Liparis tanakae]